MIRQAAPPGGLANYVDDPIIRYTTKQYSRQVSSIVVESQALARFHAAVEGVLVAAVEGQRRLESLARNLPAGASSV